MLKLPHLSDGVLDLLMRPWFDRMALNAVARWLFPLSRAWAAAATATDPRALADEIGGVRLPLAQLERAWRTTRERQAAYERAASAWEHAFFGPGTPPPTALAEAEAERARAAQAFMSTRTSFLPFHLVRALPAVRWAIEAPETVERSRHATRAAAPRYAFPARSAERAEISRSFRPGPATHSWIRLPSRVGEEADTAWARVIAPTGIADPPTIVFLHGLAMELEFFASDGGIAESFAAAGIRVIQPEGPGHGRRRRDGYYGGEPIVAAGPLGMIEAFEAWVGEAAAWIEWARATSRGKVGLAGLSLGALTSQLAAAAAGAWPEAARPDALLLIATSGDVIEAGSDGSLGVSLGAPLRLEEAGWTPAKLAPWRCLLEPTGAPALDPARIVVVLGEADDLTPYRGGAALAERWRVPDGNVFTRKQGHFSVALDVSRRSAPLARMAALLR
jgi:pimeloyl-ACP methyl ester carboxylesterase